MNPLESAVLELAKRVATLESAIFVRNGKGQCRHIMATVARAYGYRVADIMSKRRFRDLAECSAVAMFLCRELTDLSLHEIGNEFLRDHTCVSHAARTVPEWLSNPESKFRARVEAIRATLTQTKTSHTNNGDQTECKSQPSKLVPVEHSITPTRIIRICVRR